MNTISPEAAKALLSLPLDDGDMLARLASKTCGAHMAAAWTALHDEDPEADEVFERLADGPFDGCTDCEAREYLSSARPMIALDLIRFFQEELGLDDAIVERMRTVVAAEWPVHIKVAAEIYAQEV